MKLTLAIVLALAAVIGATAVHYEAIRRMDGFARRSPGPYPVLLAVISGLVALHLLEIGVYAGLFMLADGPLNLGGFIGANRLSRMDYIYYAAEAYASLGYGDVYPAGEMRLIASIAPLNGILLLSWSGAFLFSLADDWRQRR